MTRSGRPSRCAGRDVRVFAPPSALVVGEYMIRGDEHHYIARVRRAVVGDTIQLVDGEGQTAMAKILAITDVHTQVQIYQPFTLPQKNPHLRVLLPLIKGDRMDTALEKLVEVGVDDILLWPAARAVVKLEPDRREARIAKYQLALQAAARQSNRAHVPTIAWADSLATAIAGLSGMTIVLDPGSEAPLIDALNNVEGSPTSDIDTEATEVTFVSGPEGGFAPAEMATLTLAGFAHVGLGTRILRAETAPVVAVAIARAWTRS
jgi:16S rRNA (uracil1498-N3)-methyltransferase